MVGSWVQVIFNNLFNLVIIGLLMWSVILMVRLRSGSRGESAMDVLNRRYAAGKVTKEQFDQMRRIWKAQPETPP